MDRSLLPFYFPTNAILLDDDTNFLKHFMLLLDSDLPCRPYSSAHTALEQINNQASIIQSFKNFTNVILLDDMDEGIYLDLNNLHKLAYNKDRFSQISVVIVDYDMPEMNGLDFCRQIKHPEIKKILLTGKADEKIAVEAFNEGLIHRYFKKSISNIDIRINKAITDLQLEYFSDTTKPIHLALTNKIASYLTDKQFNKMYLNLIDKKKCIEFYMWGHPKGILMLDIEGNSSFLFVMSKDALDTHHEIALSCDAPPELLKLIANRNHVPWFPTEDGYYTKDCQLDWRDHIYPAHFLCGNDNINLCSLVSPTPIEALDTTRIQSYQTYLNIFDADYSMV